MDEYYFTEKGYKKLKDEIEKIEKLIKRDIAKEIATARAHGDLRENAEYAAAKDKQQMYMVKLGQLQERFARARIVRKQDSRPDTVALGKRVKIKDRDSGDELEYIILGDGETNVEKRIISYHSPLARALIGHKRGDLVDVRLPRGIKKLEILGIEFYED